MLNCQASSPKSWGSVRGSEHHFRETPGGQEGTPGRCIKSLAVGNWPPSRTSGYVEWMEGALTSSSKQLAGTISVSHSCCCSNSSAHSPTAGLAAAGALSKGREGQSSLFFHSLWLSFKKFYQFYHLFLAEIRGLQHTKADIARGTLRGQGTSRGENHTRTSEEEEGVINDPLVKFFCVQEM